MHSTDTENGQPPPDGAMAPSSNGVSTPGGLPWIFKNKKILLTKHLRGSAQIWLSESLSARSDEETGRDSER